MYKIIFYEDKNGKSDIIEYLDELQEKGKNNKDARINRDKILTYMGALAEYGTRVGNPIVKHIVDEIWELRPLKNRVFFFYWKNETFVLLHYYIKKTKKTPKREIERARINLASFLERNGEDEEN